MTYDDWKTTDLTAADYCSNGHYHCPPCPELAGTRREHPCCECDHEPLEQACADHGCEPYEDCLAGCLCGRCDDERHDNGPRFGEGQ